MLVAVSIPVFTAQLSKARLATNQANARAAYAAAVAEELTKDHTSTSSGGTYTYDVAKAKIDSTATAGSNSAQSTDISTWTAERSGKAVGKVWTITIDDKGGITEIKTDAEIGSAS